MTVERNRLDLIIAVIPDAAPNPNRLTCDRHRATAKEAFIDEVSKFRARAARQRQVSTVIAEDHKAIENLRRQEAANDRIIFRRNRIAIDGNNISQTVGQHCDIYCISGLTGKAQIVAVGLATTSRNIADQLSRSTSLQYHSSSCLVVMDFNIEQLQTGTQVREDIVHIRRRSVALKFNHSDLDILTNKVIARLDTNPDRLIPVSVIEHHLGDHDTVIHGVVCRFGEDGQATVAEGIGKLYRLISKIVQHDVDDHLRAHSRNLR